MKRLIIYSLFFLACCMRSAAQEPLIAYALKGKVTAVYKNEESTLKIGRVLLPGAILKLPKDASVTLICKKGMQFVVNGEATVPVVRYKDSCRVKAGSITSNYLAYVWGQMYSYSPDHKKEDNARESLLAVSRSGGVENTRKYNPNKLQIEFSKGMDTLYCGSRDFPLSWSCFDYEGGYEFRLFEKEGANPVYRIKTENNFVMMGTLRDKLQTGRFYAWNISAPKAGPIRKRLIKLIPQERIDSLAAGWARDSIPGESAGAGYFRVAYLLEQHHFLAEALEFYQMAAKADPGMHIYRDQLIRFRNEFYIQD